MSKLPSPVQFDWIPLLSSKYFVRDGLSKQCFGHNSYQSLLESLKLFLLLQSISLNFIKKIKQVKRVKIPNLMTLCKHYFAYLV